MIALRLRLQFVLNNGPEGDMQYYTAFTKEQFSLITWLLKNVGPYRVEPKKISQNEGRADYHQTLLMPIEGCGWRIAEGFRDERPVDRFNAENIADVDYDPVGPYGDWLCVEDDEKALLIKRLGMVSDD